MQQRALNSASLLCGGAQRQSPPLGIPKLSSQCGINGSSATARHQARNRSRLQAVISAVVQAPTTTLRQTTTASTNGNGAGTLEVPVVFKISDANAKTLHMQIQVVSEDPKVALSGEFSALGWQRLDWVRPVEKENGSEFSGTIHLPATFGKPGAIYLTKLHESYKPEDRVYVDTVTLGNETFHAHSWVDFTQGRRIFFSSEARLPQFTPEPLKSLRQIELYALQGKNAQGSLEPHAMDKRVGADRIYMYDTYCDLGDPAKGPDFARPALGGPEHPYPRRIATNRPKCADGITETRPPPSEGKDPWVPLDEAFDELKDRLFRSYKYSGILSAIPSLVSFLFDQKPDIHHFESFRAYDALYTQADPHLNPFDLKSGPVLAKIQDFFKGSLLEDGRFPMPRVRKGRELDWFTDEEVGRQALAGQNPSSIFVATPDWLRTTAFTDAAVEGLLEGATLSARVAEGARVFAVDHFPVFVDYMDRINEQKYKYIKDDTLKKPRYQHAIRALFYLKDSGDLVPIAFEVKWKRDEKSEVFTSKDDAELWALCRAVYLSVDSAFQAAYSHFTRAHAVMEAYIIATRRMLSAMHPVFKLMEPASRYTMNIGSAARMEFLSPGTVIEGSFTPGMYTWTMIADVYGALWRFDTQNFVNDLLSRGMLKVGADGQPVRKGGRVQPLLDIYPYATDGLDIWYAFSDYYDKYLRIYYDDAPGSSKQVTDDAELMAWWDDVQHGAHPDIKEGWPELKDIASLRDILTTIAWTATAHHAAVGNGNLDYTGYMPTTPPSIRRPIPRRDSKELQALKANFEQEFFTYLSDPLDALQIIIFSLVVSQHSEGEEYIDDPNLKWIQDEPAVSVHQKFVQVLKKLDEEIHRRNANAADRIRCNKGLPYTFMIPHSPSGITSKGVAQSVSY